MTTWTGKAGTYGRLFEISELLLGNITLPCTIRPRQLGPHQEFAGSGCDSSPGGSGLQAEASSVSHCNAGGPPIHMLNKTEVDQALQDAVTLTHLKLSQANPLD
jgi:hypothetical protein